MLKKLVLIIFLFSILFSETLLPIKIYTTDANSMVFYAQSNISEDEDTVRIHIDKFTYMDGRIFVRDETIPHFLDVPCRPEYNSAVYVENGLFFIYYFAKDVMYLITMDTLNGLFDLKYLKK